ncbi:HAD family hydrolase [Xylophilus ampelinus]|uniref:Phosphoglycolate phosphatase n=1 Tax=Xylophilus ampelinus TaxID=54067 RepID=A0A318SGQ4_9BURK|nr:HAD-IA family hydrolase [Xylophilus ampelinus]MCS4510568.1 HAD-IA family hydrolase [Xylophilus ampelinus]PYE77805.1 phosphoglycolate phosphatase [Xylophilus ampelinus]
MTARFANLAAVLFDLDGTLVDSAPDLGAAANALREAKGLVPLPLEQYRPMAGAGARGMLGIAFDMTPDDAAFPAMREQFFDLFESRANRSTAAFSDIEAMLSGIRERRLPWGIVTNKATRFTAPLVKSMPLLQTAGAVVCGDTTPHSKPHPAPLLEASRLMGLDATRCVYVGDDERDIQAGRAAGMVTVAAAWGYLGRNASVDDWGADAVIRSPFDLLTLLKSARNG